MRWLIRIVLSLVLLAVLLVGALFLLPAEKIAGLASEQIRAATGRDLTLSGRLRPSLWPEIGVATGPVTVSNVEWSDEGPMLAAEGLSIGLDLKALIGGDIVIREVSALSPRIVLEKAADGRVNWAFDGADGGPGTVGGGERGGMRAFTLDEGRISDGTLVYIDHQAGSRTELAALDATLGLPAFDGPADLGLSARLNGQPVSATARIGSFSGMLDGAVSALTTDIGVGAAKLAFDGRAGLTPLAAEGALDADLSDLGALFAALDAPAPDLPPGVGKRLSVKGQVTYTSEGSLYLRDATLTQDSNVISGGADLTFGAKPRLTGQFTTGALDLSPFMGGGGEDPAGGGGGPDGWSTDPIDVSALGALDAEVAITADSVDLGSAQLGPTRILATLTDRRLVFDLREVRGYDGTVTGNFVINGRGGLSVGGDLTVSGVAMQALLKDVADYDRLLGQGDLELEFLGSGASMAAIMNSLSGSGSIRFGKGELRGLDLAGMLRTLDTSYVGEGAKTIFDSIAASFTIENGVLKNDDLDFLAPLLSAGGKGKVGIGGRTLDYRVVPVALPGADGEGGVKVPLMITGTWAKPRFQLDLEALAREKLQIEEKQKALEEKARAAAKAAEERAKEQAAKKLGVAPEEGEDLEDAAKRKLEEEAGKALRKLFGGD